jgi:hypothetical protein
VALAFTAITFVLAPVAYMSMLSGFHAYDDEGYFLITLRDYLSGGPLFKDAFPVYGPFFYEAMGGLFRLLGLEPGHDSGRLVTLTVWLLASLVGGLGAYRLTRNVWLGLGAQFVTFSVLTALTNEPMHPSGLISLLLVCLVVVASFRSAWPRATAALIGAIVGALCMIKINVGAFAGIAVVFAWAASLGTQWRRLLMPVMAVLITAVPPALMVNLLSRDWVVEFAIVAALSAAAVGVVSVAHPPRYLPAPAGKWLAIGGAALGAACLAIALAGGTRPEDLWNGLLVSSVRLPQIFVWPMTVNAGYDLWAALSLVAAFAVVRPLVRARVPIVAVAMFRIGIGFFTWLALLVLPSLVFLLALPLVWIAIKGPQNDVDRPSDPYCRLMLPALAVLQSLQAYPVAGTQLAMAALCLVPIGAVCLGDGIRELRIVGDTRRSPVTLAAWVPAVAVAINVLVFLIFTIEAAAPFKTGVPLGLPGAASLRLSAQDDAHLRALVADLDRGCSSFITFPGMNSFYVWTAKKPPGQVTTGVWMLVLDSRQQQSIVEQLQGRQRLCVVKNQKVIDFWAEGRPIPSRPLVDFIYANFVDAASYGDYELLVQKNQ